MAYYEIIVKGHISSRSLLIFKKMGLTLLESGCSRLYGKVDQTDLYTVLQLIRELGLTLLSVNRVMNVDDQFSPRGKMLTGK